jgi:hypothetical protein
MPSDATDRQAELESAITQLINELKDLLSYSKEVVGMLRIVRYLKQKTIYRMNIYSGIYQRTEGIIALVENKQTNGANILLRSTWELLAAHDFVGMHRGNLYLEILSALEGKSVKKQWTGIKNLRHKYPSSNTWQDRWSDELIEERINWGDAKLQRFRTKYPTINLNKYESLLGRLEAVDDYNIAKNPNHKFLSQMDYRTVYSLLSEDVHSTIYGTSKNTHLTNHGIDVRLDKFDLDSLRALVTAYGMLLSFTNFITRHYKLSQASRIRELRNIEKRHTEIYQSFE